MKLEEANQIIHEVHGRNYSWLKEWGLGTIKEAIRTIEARKSATAVDKQLAESVKNKLSAAW